MEDLTVETELNGTTLNMKLIGKINAVNSEMIMNKAKENSDDFSAVIIDASELEYISSSGIRQIVNLNILANSKGGTLVIRNTNEFVKDVFDGIGLFELISG